MSDRVPYDDDYDTERLRQRGATSRAILWITSLFTLFWGIPLLIALLPLLCCCGVPFLMALLSPSPDTSPVASHSVSTEPFVENKDKSSDDQSTDKPADKPVDPPRPQPLTTSQLAGEHDKKPVLVKGKVTKVDERRIELDGLVECTKPVEPVKVGDTITIEGTAYWTAGKAQIGKVRVVSRE